MTGRDLGAYHHEFFLRGLPELARGIQRLRIKGCGPRRGRRDEVVTPDHYAMPYVPVQGDTSTASTPVLLSTTPVPSREEPESSQASAVASLTESTLGAGIGGIGAAVPSPHDWAKLLHWKRVLLLERQELEQQELERQMQNQRLLTSTLEMRHLELVRALTAQAELGRAAPPGFVSRHHMDNPDARTMRNRALAVALLQNLNSA
jgi:hypothetical protein